MSFNGGGDSGRGSDVSGRRETYYRRHDPAAPGPTGGIGGTEGPPTTSEAFKYHAWDKHSTGEKVGRAVFGAIMPGGFLLQGLMAKSQAARDVAGTKGSFDFDYPTGGAAPRPDDDNAPAVVAPKKKRSVVATGVKRTAAAAPQKRVIPKKSITVASAPKPKATGTSKQGILANIQTTPYGILGDAPVTQKTLKGSLGA